MLFHTPEFAAFLVLVVCSLAAARNPTTRKVVLLLSSYAFYAWAGWVFLLPLLVTTTIDFLVGMALGRETRPERRRAVLLLSIVANLGLLAYFKYFNFFIETAATLAQSVGYDFAPSLLRLILPIGISFYTFHSMSYVIDVYRGEIKPCRSALDFGLFITFFPVLVAGPILRARQFLPQLGGSLRPRLNMLIVTRFMRGLAKKVLVADNIAPFADRVFSSPEVWPSSMIWMATVVFAVQIYCDFSGYSDMARALAGIFGLEIPLNFDRPYFATTPAEFWRRWHISLSTWLRDYLYIPLGGNRRGPARTYVNLMITMLLGGLWHGASWNFVIWGFLHGALLILHRLSSSWVRPSRLPMAGSWILTQLAILFTWIAFRVTDFSAMTHAMRKFILIDGDLTFSNRGLGGMFVIWTGVIVVGFLLLHVAAHRFGDLDERIARLSLPAVLAIGLIAGVLFVGGWPADKQPFIYFQF